MANKSQSFSMNEAIKFGWNTTKKNLGFLILLEILTVGIILILQLGKSTIDKNQAGIIFLASLLVYIIQMGLELGWLNISLKYIKKKQVKLSDLTAQAGQLPSYIGAGILYSMIYILGFILLIIPGIIWSIKFQYFGFIILEERLGPIKALKRSAQITRGNKWKLFGFSFILVAINLLGLLCLGVGLLITMPLTMLANTYVYKKLSA